MSLQRDADLEEWIGRARRASVREYLERRGLWTRAMIGDRGTACPVCGGTDRFAVNVRKNVWNCRKSGVGGGALALEAHFRGVQTLRGAEFMDAVEAITGEPPPRRSEESEHDRRARLAREAERAAALQAERAQQEAKEAIGQRFWRERERVKAWQIWRDGGRDWRGTPVERYLTLRRCAAGDDTQIRFHPDCPYWADGGVLFHGPAMLAAIRGPELHESGAERFSGIHMTWLDLDRPPKFRRVVIHPDTGAQLAPKKVRGSQKGGSILIARARDHQGEPCAPRMIVAGEGIETTLAAWNAMRNTRPEALHQVEFRAFVNLGNFAGKASKSLPHPTETMEDKAGRVRRVRYQGPEPLWPDDMPPVPIPESCTDLVWLMDADGDPVRAEADVARGAARYALHYPWLTVRVARPEPGTDFCSMAGEAA